MALSSNTPHKRGTGIYNELPVKASAHIYFGSMVGYDEATGYFRALTAGDPFYGHAETEADNSSGANAALDVPVMRDPYPVQVTLTGVSVEDMGRDVYASDDATTTFDPAGTSGANSYVGKVIRYVTTNTAVILAIPASHQ
jgi:hypothetical protein